MSPRQFDCEPLQVPVIGKAPVLSQMTQREFDIILVAIGVQLVMGIYNFVIFLRRRQEFSSLLLAICCLLAMIRSIANGFLISYFFPDIHTLGFHLQYSLDYATMVGLSCCYVAFIQSSYPGHLMPMEARIIPAYLAINMVFVLGAVFTPTAFFTDLKSAYLTMTFLNLIAAFIILQRTVRRQRASARMALSGFLLMFATATWDLLCSYGWVPEPFLTPYGLTIFIFMQSQVVAGRFAVAFRTAEHLSRKLQHEVSLATQKLQKQGEKLEKQHKDLLRSHSDLQAVHEEKSGFFRHISHEIRTPLTLILGTITNTRRTEQYEQGLGVIEKNSLRLLRLVNQLLDLQRYQSLRDPVHNVPLRFSQVMRSATEYVQQSCQELGIQFAWIDEIPNTDEKIQGQVDALEKILLNYLANAMKYTPAGGEIRVRLQKKDRCLRCTVEDTGPGIRAEDQAQLFKVFSRLKDADQKMREGTGIGLALCRELAASMQGRVGVESEVGQGSRFWMEFPRVLRQEEYLDLVCFLAEGRDAESLPTFVKLHTQLQRCFFSEDRNALIEQVTQQNCRLVLISKGDDAKGTLELLQQLRDIDSSLHIFLLIDQQERVEFVHDAMQTGILERTFYRPMSAADMEVLEAYRIREILAEKPILDLLFLDDHAEIRAFISSQRITEPEKPSYQNLLPQTEVRDLREQSTERRHGFDAEDRSFSEDVKFRNFASMTDLARAIPEYVDVPNAVRAQLTTAKLSVRMQRDSQGWRPVRIDGEPYLRAIFAESWVYLSKQSEFRRVLENIEYKAVRFEVNLGVSSSLAIDEKPQSRIQGNFIALDLQLKRSTAKEWKLLAAWQAQGGAALGLNVIGLAVYAYEAYKNRNREDPILLRLQQSPAYKAPVRD